jgi:hypothetical protein
MLAAAMSGREMKSMNFWAYSCSRPSRLMRTQASNQMLPPVFGIE